MDTIKSKEIQAAWALFEALRLRAGVKTNDLEGMQKLFRDFAMRLLTQQKYLDKIMAGGQILMKFPNSEYPSKASYISKMSQPGAWLEDVALYPALEALGYQPVMHLKGTALPPYVPFVQQDSDNPLTIHLVNHGAKTGGTHWECKDQSNPGGGDCGAYSVAQQMMQDYKNITIPEAAVSEFQEVLQASTEQTPVVHVPEIPYQRDDNAVTREIAIQFAQLEKIAHQRRTRIASKLEKFSTQDLAALYETAMKRNGDYLLGHLRILSKREMNIPKLLSSGTLDHDELVHALSIEAWRNPESFEFLDKAQPSLVDKPSKPKSAIDTPENNHLDEKEEEHRSFKI